MVMTDALLTEIERQENIKEAMEYRLMATPIGRSPKR